MKRKNTNIKFRKDLKTEYYVLGGEKKKSPVFIKGKKKRDRELEGRR